MRIEPGRQLVLEELHLVTDVKEVVVVSAVVVTDVLGAQVLAHRLAATVARHVPGWREREHPPIER
jgi:diaminopimelate decarboxylase